MSFSEWQPVESSNLKTVRYEGAELVLEIEFNSGDMYQYFDVPEAVFRELLSSESKGKYFHANIKGEYRYERL